MIPLLVSAWPVLAPLLPVLTLVLALVFLVRGDRRAVLHLLALVACYLIGALLMEFATFLAALMARGGDRAVPELGTGTRLLVQTLASPRSIAAPPLSLAAWAAYALLASYLWLLVAGGLHWRGGRRGAAAGPARRKGSAKRQRKAAD